MIISIFFILFQNNIVLEKKTEISFADQAFGGMPLAFAVAKDQSLLGMFQMDHPFCAKLDGSYSEIRPFGKGPSDIHSAMGLSVQGDKLYVLEFGGNIKTFGYHDGQYDYVSIAKIKHGSRPMIEHYLVVTKDAFVVGGYWTNDINNWKDATFFPIQVFDQKGTPVKQLGGFKMDPKLDHYEMEYFIVHFGNEILGIREDEENIRRFSDTSYKELPSIKIQRPQKYAGLPDGFYTINNKGGKYDINRLLSFRKGYARVCALVSLPKILVVQFRNVASSGKKFTLLFLAEKSFKVIGNTQTDDLLLAGSSENSLYFHKNGDPSLDDVDTFNISIFMVKNEE